MFKKNITLPLLLIIWILIHIGKLFRSVVLFIPKLIYKHLTSVKPIQSKTHRKKKKSAKPKKLPKLTFNLPTLPKIGLHLKIPFRDALTISFRTPTKVLVGLVFVAISLFIYSFFLVDLVNNLPSPTQLKNSGGALTTQFYDRNGRLLYKLYEGRNRTLIKLSDLPPTLVNATIAIEDKNFYHHSGVDILGVTRAAVIDLRDHQLQGGSTITQQLVKNSLLTTDKTWQRKAKEMILAFWAEKIYNKQEILQMYFNEVPYGGPAWGIEAASETYFGKPASDLNLAEASYLAGLPASPTTYSPYGSSPELGKERQREVLRRMVEDKYITQSQSDQAYGQHLEINPPTTMIKAPHFVMYARSLLSERYGERVVSEGGLSVITSLDLDTQEMVQKTVTEEVAKLAPLDVTNGAAMVVDPKTGQIIAMVGSKSYFDQNEGNFNDALALRQPGSSIKPITYATAFKQGFTPGSMIMDAPVVFKNAWETYAPVNYDGRFHGPVSIRTALGSSYNIPAVKTLSVIGISNMIQTAHDMGITTLNEANRYGLSLTLGGGEVKLADMMTVYSTFSQNGMKYQPTPILKVTDPHGVVLEDNSEPQGEQVISPGIAYLITNILADNNARTPAFGPSSLLNIPGQIVAVKTGTTDSKRDNWTFGYTPNLVVGVWVGNNDNHPMNPALTSGVTGAAPIWNRIMTTLLSGKPQLAFARPDGVMEGSVDGRKDLVLLGMPRPPVALYSPTPRRDDKTITFQDPFSAIKEVEQRKHP